MIRISKSLKKSSALRFTYIEGYMTVVI